MKSSMGRLKRWAVLRQSYSNRDWKINVSKQIQSGLCCVLWFIAESITISLINWFVFQKKISQPKKKTRCSKVQNWNDKIKDNNLKMDHSRLLPDIWPQQNTINGQEDVQDKSIFATRRCQDPPVRRTSPPDFHLPVESCDRTWPMLQLCSLGLSLSS